MVGCWHLLWSNFNISWSDPSCSFNLLLQICMCNFPVPIKFTEILRKITILLIQGNELANVPQWKKGVEIICQMAWNIYHSHHILKEKLLLGVLDTSVWLNSDCRRSKWSKWWQEFVVNLDLWIHCQRATSETLWKGRRNLCNLCRKYTLCCNIFDDYSIFEIFEKTKTLGISEFLCY